MNKTVNKTDFNRVMIVFLLDIADWTAIKVIITIANSFIVGL